MIQNCIQPTANRILCKTLCFGNKIQSQNIILARKASASNQFTYCKWFVEVATKLLCFRSCTFLIFHRFRFDSICWMFFEFMANIMMNFIAFHGHFRQH